jgi:hypothetical protein
VGADQVGVNIVLAYLEHGHGIEWLLQGVESTWRNGCRIGMSRKLVKLTDVKKGNVGMPINISTGAGTSDASQGLAKRACVMGVCIDSSIATMQLQSPCSERQSHV